MPTIWVYTVEQQAKGIVIANSEYCAIENVVTAYKKHGDDICPADVQVTKYCESEGWFKDYPNVLEVINLN